MPEFRSFINKLRTHFQEMTEDASALYQTDADNDHLWEVYLDSFPEGRNPVFRKRRRYDCSCCRHFVKTFGNVVTIKHGQVTSIWDFELDDGVFSPVVKAMASYVKSCAIVNKFHAAQPHVGTDHSMEQGENAVIQWDHLSLDIPDKFLTHRHLSQGDDQARFRDTRNVFKRSLDEITEDSVLTLLELIAQNSLYRGQEWENELRKFLQYKKAYDRLPDEDSKDLFAWEMAATAGAVVGKIRNHSIGTLLLNISEGEDLDVAVRKYEAIVAPANYMRPKAIYTKQMVEEAQKKIIELGFEDSLGRRFATLDDITVNNILYTNRDAAKRVAGAMDVFASMLSDARDNAKSFDHVEEIGIEDFISRVLPTSREVEAYLENRHAANMVSLIAPINREAKSMFKWNNPFSWAYAGNVTDSMKDRVKAAGGRVDGVLRFSIQWNDEDNNPNDFDAHCIEPDGNRIFYKAKRHEATGGNLDVDIINPTPGVPAVENITWPALAKMRNGTYRFLVHCFSNRGGRSGFKAEIEYNGEIHSYEYPNELRQSEYIDVAEVTLKDGKFSIVDRLPSSTASRELWGVHTNEFIPVSVMMYSPNYWDNQHGIGNLHFFFMLKDCANPDQPNGFYNEFLNQQLLENKRVLEALGAKLRVQEAEDQLSGVGFSSTKRNDLIVRVTGTSKRVLRIKF